MREMKDMRKSEFDRRNMRDMKKAGNFLDRVNGMG
jgi:hypothetical protein